jgi:hypothetical protein
LLEEKKGKTNKSKYFDVVVAAALWNPAWTTTNCRNSVKLAKFTTIFLPSEVLSNLQFRKFLQCTLAALSSHCILFPEAETPEIIILLKD